jgi:mannitol-specific phosphotransferase system IIBC component
MDIISTWSTKIVEEVAPDEVDLAPLMVQAFIQGGEERKELFRQAKGGEVGAFGPGDITALFPYVLQGIAVAAPVLYSVLTSGVLEKILSAVKDLLSIHDSLARKKQSESFPDNPYAPLKRMVTAFSKKLQSTPIPQDQRDLITYRVLRVLLEEPSSATEFVRKIAGGSSDAPHS